MFYHGNTLQAKILQERREKDKNCLGVWCLRSLSTRKRVKVKNKRKHEGKIECPQEIEGVKL